MDQEQRADLCREACRDLNNGELERLAARLGTEVQWHRAPSKEAGEERPAQERVEVRAAGRERVLEVVRSRMNDAYFPVEILRLDIVGERVVCTVRGQDGADRTFAAVLRDGMWTQVTSEHSHEQAVRDAASGV
jgi:hypothetical protein